MSLEEEQEADSNLQKHNHCCISHAFASCAQQNSTRTAVVHVLPSSQPPISLTYAQLSFAVRSLSNRISNILDNGCSSSDRTSPRIVGIYTPPSPEYLVGVISVLRLGEAFLPLDPSWPKERVLYAISSSNASLVIAFRPASDNWLATMWSCSILYVDMRELLGDEPENLEMQRLPWPCQSMNRRNFCYVMYTSGSTGKPKGVCGTEEGDSQLMKLQIIDIVLMKQFVANYT